MNQDKSFELNGVQFVWNRAKSRRNLAKHGISFECAVEAFFDPFLKLIDASIDLEERNALIGMDESWKLLLVVHISSEFGAVRIISARKATNFERTEYEN